MLGKLFCCLGLHEWEKEPSHKEIIKDTGINFAFSSAGLQKGQKRCLRLGCMTTLNVWREGFLSTAIFPSSSGPWRKLGRKKEIEIDRLANL